MAQECINSSFFSQLIRGIDATRNHQQKLLKGWVSKLSPLLFPEVDSCSLDFHSIGHRGEDTDLENRSISFMAWIT